MIIFPAIDIRGGNCVRLTKGDYTQEKVYDLSPLEAAMAHKNAGADYLHVVDLDAAKSGTNENFDIIASLAPQTGMFIQTGGGIRNSDIIERYLSSGISRVILGTAAVKDRAFLEEVLHNFPGKTAVSLDVLDEVLYTDGWTKKSAYTIYSFLDSFDTSLLSAAVVTDIAKDGMMIGTNLNLIAALAEKYPTLDFIASGGVCTIKDVIALKKMKVYGAIIGKALYEGTLMLDQVLEENER